MRRAVAVVIVAVSLVAGCVDDPGVRRAADRATTALELTPTDGQRRASLATLRRLDDHPLYEMTWTGPTPKLPDRAAGTAGAIAVTERLPAGRTRYACTVFATTGSAPLLGRNFDWDPAAALVLRSLPADGYASLSLVDLSYVDIPAAVDLDDPVHRDGLLRTPALPFDGVNEHGLAIGMAADEGGRTQPRPDAARIGSLAIIRLALDRARTVAEALALFNRYEIDFSGGPALHYLLADATGAAAVVEYVDGAMTVLHRDQPWHLMTNFPLAVTGADGRRADRRYRTGAAALGAAGGQLDAGAALALLRDVRQGHTQWSLVYDLRAGTAAVVTGQRYERVHAISLR